MESSLIGEAHARPTHERNVVDELSAEPELTREGRVCLQRIHLLGVRLSRRSVQVTFDPFERAVDAVLVNDALYLIDRGASGIPHRLCM